MKKVGSTLYAHRSCAEDIPEKAGGDSAAFIRHAEDRAAELNFCWDILKYTDGGTVSLIQSPDWDTEDEPSVGDALCIHPDGTEKIIKASGKIYHHKWAFVHPDYPGFDTAASEKRSEMWQKNPVLCSEKKRIGTRRIWNRLLEEQGIPLHGCG